MSDKHSAVDLEELTQFGYDIVCVDAHKELITSEFSPPPRKDNVLLY